MKPEKIMTVHISSYPKVHNIGHPEIADLFSGPVVVEEKVDGSQFSMTRIGGELVCRSKGQQLVVDAPEGMFEKAVEVAKSLPLREGWVYRCEYLQKPKHNTLTYGRVPRNHLMLFDVMTGLERYLDGSERSSEAVRIGIEPVPLLTFGVFETFGALQPFLERESILGGCKIEGFVVKNYAKFTPDGKMMCGKYVSEAFKEKHGKEWKASNPTQQDVTLRLVEELRTEARWQKAIQHLRERGQITGTPKDIGPLLKEVQGDTEAEEAAYVKDELYKHHWPHIRRMMTYGLPEWYKEQLAKSAFPTATP